MLSQEDTPSIATRRKLDAGTSANPPVTSFAASAGKVQVHPCATAEYTLVDSGPVFYHVPFVDCIVDREECCPFIAAGTKGSRVQAGRLPSAQTGEVERNLRAAQTSGSTIASTCAGGYTAVSGQCCPRYTRS